MKKKTKFVNITVDLDKECIDYIKMVAKETGNSFQQSARFVIWLALKNYAP